MRLNKKAPLCQTKSYPHFLTIGVNFFPARSLSWQAPRPAAQCERHRLFGRCALETSPAGLFWWRDRASFTSHSQSAPLEPNDCAAWQRTCRLLLEREGKSTWVSIKTISLCLSSENFAHLNKASTTTSSLETFKSFRCRIRCSCLAVNFRKSSLSVHCWKSLATCSSQADLKSGNPQITVCCNNGSASWLSKQAFKSDCTTSARRGSPICTCQPQQFHSIHSGYIWFTTIDVVHKSTDYTTRRCHLNGFPCRICSASRKGAHSKAFKAALAADKTFRWTGCSIPSMLLSTTSHKWPSFQKSLSCCIKPCWWQANLLWWSFMATPNLSKSQEVHKKTKILTLQI